MPGLLAIQKNQAIQMSGHLHPGFFLKVNYLWLRVKSLQGIYLTLRCILQFAHHLNIPQHSMHLFLLEALLLFAGLIFQTGVHI